MNKTLAKIKKQFRKKYRIRNLLLLSFMLWFLLTLIAELFGISTQGTKYAAISLWLIFTPASVAGVLYFKKTWPIYKIRSLIVLYFAILAEGSALGCVVVAFAGIPLP